MKITRTPVNPPKKRWAQAGGRPDAERLRAALEAIDKAVEPDVAILYGSAARGGMTPDSDVDLLIVKDGIDQDAVNRAADAGTEAGGGRAHVMGASWVALLGEADSPTALHGAALHEGLVVAEHGRCDPESTRQARDEGWRAPESAGERERRVLELCAREAQEWLDLAAARRRLGRKSGQEGFGGWEADSAKSAAEACVMALCAAEGRIAREDRAAEGLEVFEKANGKLPPDPKAGWLTTQASRTTAMTEMQGHGRNRGAGDLLRWARKTVRETIDKRRKQLEDSRRAGAAATPRRRI